MLVTAGGFIPSPSHALPFFSLTHSQVIGGVGINNVRSSIPKLIAVPALTWTSGAGVAITSVAINAFAALVAFRRWAAESRAQAELAQIEKPSAMA